MISFALERRLRSALVRPKPPKMLDWAQSTIVVPDGPLRGTLFDADTQPFTRLFFNEVDSGRWDRVVALGPTQTGKSLSCYVIPVCHHLFAIGETVVAGIPTADMADDKWQLDFLPVIESSPELRKVLPVTGQCSRAGRVRTRVKFRNGATLRFMSGGGNDKTRAGFTARVLAVTEVDGLDRPGATSREADKLKQLEARQRAFLAAGTRTYLECTVSTTAGRIWQEYIGGTESRIVRPCPHCGVFVTPGRDRLLGWQDADTELESRANAAWSCPACAALWTEAERYSANRKSILAHRGQEVTADGKVIGPAPATRTLGFRWQAVDNHFATAADVAADEFNATKERDKENSEKELCQFVHCIPYDPPNVEVTPLEVDVIARRTTPLKRGIVPQDCYGITVGVDTNKRHLHWVAIAWLQTGAGFVIDYGVQPVASDRLGFHHAAIDALKKLKVYFDNGWQEQNGTAKAPSQVWIDSGWYEHTDAVYEFCHFANTGISLGKEHYRPSKGYGQGQRRMEIYHVPKKVGNEVRYVGNGFHLAKLERGRLLLAHVNADYWKSQLHQRLALPPEAQLALLLFESSAATDHTLFAEQLTAEKQVERYVEGQGEQICWERIRKDNHFLDAAYSAVASGELLLAGLMKKPPQRMSLREMSEAAAAKRQARQASS